MSRIRGLVRIIITSILMKKECVTVLVYLCHALVHVTQI